jgi:FAD/FMN-containing dehydrogenase
VEAGMTLARIQEVLRKSGQWLPIDPPQAEKLTIGDLLALNASGSRRLGYGTIRDYLIGIKVALADGQIIKAGGKVVKNVAGYDLCKLFIGAKHSLGVIVEATFKLRPLPEVEVILERTIEAFEEMEMVRRTIIESTEPVLFDAVKMGGGVKLWAAFAGSREDVAAQVEMVKREGFRESEQAGYAGQFWSGDVPEKRSMLPSRIVGELKDCGAESWLAHLGNGVAYLRGGKGESAMRNLKAAATCEGEEKITKVLMERVKQVYDPKLIFPSYA